VTTRDRDAADGGVSAASHGADELLSAYAAGGLAPAEAARVEAYLADHPEARDELDEIARTLAAVRAAEPRPHGEPDWDAMAREIQRACIDEPGAPWWQIWRRRWSRRPAVLAAAGAVAVALAFVVLSRGDDAAPDAGRSAAVDPRGRAAPAGGGHEDGARVESAAGDADAADGGAATSDDPTEEVAVADPDLRAPVLGDLSSDELDRLEDALDGEAAPEDAFVADLLAAGRIDGFQDATDRREIDDADDDESPSIDPFRAPDYLPIDQLADELPDEAIEAIDRFLAEVQAG
jgi:hypothetical protein